MTDPLGELLGSGNLRLEPLAKHHRTALKAACAEDSEIWPIYSASYGPEHFDAQFDTLRARSATFPFAIIIDGTLVGMTSFLGYLPERQTVEIGTTYLVPE